MPLKALEAFAPATPILTPEQRKAAEKASGNGKTPWSAEDVRTHLAAWGIEVTKDYAKDGVPWWEFDCPYNPEHKRNGYAKIDPAGILAGCNHDSCDWTWTDLRARFDAEYASRQNGDKHAKVSPPAALDSADEGYELAPLDWQALLRDGVPEVEYIREPYLPKLARIWVWGQTGSVKSLWCEHEAASLSREGVRVSYFAEENPIGEELRRIGLLRPDPAYFRLFHRSGMDLLDEKWIAALLAATAGDDIIFLDSWTDLWSGDENDNRAVQQFDSEVLKPLQAQGVTPVVIHHMGHRYMYSDRGGATAGRGASSLGQKADVTLEFKSAGENLFTIVYGKSRIGGLHQPERSFKVEDTDDGRVQIVEGDSPEDRAVAELAEKMAQAVLTVPRGYLTTNELRVAVGGSRTHQAAALVVLEDDPRVTAGVEKVETRDGKRRDSKVWRPARGVVGARLPFDDPDPRADESSESSTPTPP